MRKRIKRRRQRQEGAVLVEWLIVSSSFCLLLGCMLAVRLYCSLQLQALDDAREDAWRRSMAGCNSGADSPPPLGEIANQLKDGSGPSMVKQLQPSRLDASSSFVFDGRGLPAGIVPTGGTREVRFLCNPLAHKTIPTSDVVGWLKDWF